MTIFEQSWRMSAVSCVVTIFFIIVDLAHVYKSCFAINLRNIYTDLPCEKQPIKILRQPIWEFFSNRCKSDKTAFGLLSAG